MPLIGSVVPPGLVDLTTRCPRDESRGYYHLSLRDRGILLQSTLLSH